MPAKTKKQPSKKISVQQGDKCTFVRGLPRSLSALNVQKKAREAGMTISIAYIHNIRCAANKKSREVLKRGGRKAVTGSKAQKERLFLDLVIALGASRAKYLLGQAETALSLGKVP